MDVQPDDGPLGELEERLRRYPAQRYPVQHATAQFHLGVALAGLGEFERAEAALVRAAELFDPRALTSEHGKAMNALGSVLRLAGRPAEAAEVFVRAAAAFRAADLLAEHGAACFNLGLVRRETDDVDGAIAVFAEARKLFEQANAPAHAAAAARELGAARFAAGDLDAARDVLDGSVELAARAGDEAGAGAAANVLGLVELAAGRAREAVEAFAVAAAANPRSVRREDYAMAKANLALAHEAAGQHRRARIAARQALAVASAAPPVRAQAEAALARLGTEPDDAVAVVDGEQDQGVRAAIVREELARWVDAGDAERRAEAGAWIDAQLARPARAVALAEAWVGGLLELPPPDMETVIRGVVEALRERPAGAQERFRSDVASAAARFHVPQLLRLRDEFNRIAAELGEQPAWR
ncbi:MAG: hypothetical protein KY433_09350 [Actinobacteria bacterium]|nr:hypothetical protein [Actinomycetota bacterium]